MIISYQKRTKHMQDLFKQLHSNSNKRSNHCYDQLKRASFQFYHTKNPGAQICHLHHSPGMLDMVNKTTTKLKQGMTKRYDPTDSSSMGAYCAIAESPVSVNSTAI